MTRASGRAFALAGLVAILMHLFLFAAVRPQPGLGLGGALVPPTTRYLGEGSLVVAQSSVDVRKIWSPVVASLPSPLGFSRVLGENDVKTRLSFSQPVKAEQFLVIDPAAQFDEKALASRDLMLTEQVGSDPSPPSNVFQPNASKPAARRIDISPGLKDRLVGGVVLPPELNQPAESPWEARASISVSELGTVEHVFLDQPLASIPLNQQVLQLLYGLRFKPGKAVEGNIELYAPEAAEAKGAEQ